MKPANLVLDLLRTYGRKGTDVRGLMETADMFGISENAMRVTLSRLTHRGLIEKVSRGRYRLAEVSDPINDFVEEWRLGEQRRRPWQPDHFVIAQNTALDEKDRWVLHATGFRESNSGLWLRPDNLARRGAHLRTWLHGLGLSVRCLLAENALLCETDANHFLKASYDTSLLDARYQELTGLLEQSAKRLGKLPKQAAMKESFNLGGKALQLLAKDPYLPEEVQAPVARRQLWQIMLDYDDLGRGVWTDKPATMPADITSYA